MKIIFFAAFLGLAHALEYYYFDISNNCLLTVDITGTVNLTATGEQTTKNISLNIDGSIVKGDSNCSVLKLAINKTAEIWFQFTFSDDNSSAIVTPISTFVPKAVFGDTVNKTIPVFATASSHSFPKNGSYKCNAEVNQYFEPNVTSKDFNFTVMASISDFRAQCYVRPLNSTRYSGEVKECDEDNTTTSSAPTSTTTTTHPTTPEPPAGNYTCKDGSVTKFHMVGTFQLSITYEANDTRGKRKNITKLIDVPQLSTYAGDCKANATVETLAIFFFKGWSIEYVFSSDQKANALGDKYHVSNITIIYVHDEHLPNATKPGSIVMAKYVGSGNYLEGTGKGYYQCKSNVSVTVDQVTLYTSELKYKAFNKNGNADFSGHTSKCSADEKVSTSKVVEIAVGISVAVMVLIFIIIIFSLILRKRKTGYETVQ